MTDKKKTKLVGALGDFNWQQMRDFLIEALTLCRTEEELMKIITGVIISVGTPKELAKLREKMGIKPFNEADLDKIEKLQKNEDQEIKGKILNSLKTCEVEDIPTDNYINHLLKKFNLEEK
jgi:hypothetical protein